jgi:hypothetical protein
MPAKHSHIHSGETQPIPRRAPYAWSPLPSIRTTIHPVLAVSNRPSLICDMSRHLSSLRFSHPSLSPHLLTEPATQPPMHSLTIVCPNLPWPINVKARHRNGYITVADVMDGLYHALRPKVTEAEFRSLLSHDLRHQVNKAYQQRYRRASLMDYAHEKAQGVRRVDFLGGRNTFMGLSSTKGGARVWRLNVS